MTDSRIASAANITWSRTSGRRRERLLEARVYADERGEYLAFKATEDRLTTRLASAQVIHDMIAVAEHRNWQAIQLRGSVEFRREAWLEASAARNGGQGL